MAAPLQYLLITVKVTVMEKVSFSDTKILTLFVNRLTVNDKDYLLNTDNLTQLIHMQLSQKQKTFSQFFFFFAFLKSILYFKHLPKQDDAHS